MSNQDTGTVNERSKIRSRKLYFKIMKTTKSIALVVCMLALASLGIVAVSQAKKSPAPIRALMVTGEGYHDYESQKKIISEGVSERIKIDWTILHHKKAVNGV